MLRHERLDVLVQILKSGDFWLTADLATELSVSVRTLCRDLEELKRQGYPVETERGRGGGIRLLPNWGVKRMLLSDKEVVSLLLSLAIGEKIGGPLFQTELNLVRRRIFSSLSPEQIKSVRRLKERIFIGEAASKDITLGYEKPLKLSSPNLQMAFINRQKISIVYKDMKGVKSERTVEPHALFLSWPVWYVLTFDHWRKEARTFRIDRIQNLNLLPESFKERSKEIFDQTIGDIYGKPL